MLSITLELDEQKINRTSKNGPIGVNENLYRQLINVVSRTEQRAMTVPDLRAHLLRLRRDTRPHPDWLIALGVGVACAAFGRLMGADWRGVVPIFLASGLGQTLRWKLAVRHINVFVSAGLVAFSSSFFCALASGWAGSRTVPIDMTAAVLLLVPGVALFNALYDILEGRPTVGSARAVSVIIMLAFMTAGVWMAQSLLGMSL